MTTPPDKISAGQDGTRPAMALRLQSIEVPQDREPVSIEIFARARVEGWDAKGLEVE